ncbi:MAG: CNT family concentrative nucleoside transporter, partial [Patiriisocius sp.]
MKKFLYSIVILFFFGNITAQSIEKQWIFSDIQSQDGASLVDINSDIDTFTLKGGGFEYSLAAKNNLKASGDYIFQNNVLVLFYNQPTDTIRRYRITELTESSLSFTENKVVYSFNAPQNVIEPAIFEANQGTNNKINAAIIPSQGFSFNSFWRGILGMVTLLFIAFLFSANRKAISWRTVGLGLALQLIIAVGV